MIILKKTVLFSIIHMLVDGLCAFTMAAVSPSGYAVVSAFIVYNFCAFVLQMPIGAVIDGLISRSDNHKLPLLFSIYGSVITLAGSLILIFLPGTILTAYSGVIVLGIGNAMFHVGGGVGSIIEDHINNQKGQNLGLLHPAQHHDTDGTTEAERGAGEAAAADGGATQPPHIRGAASTLQRRPHCPRGLPESRRGL